MPPRQSLNPVCPDGKVRCYLHDCEAILRTSHRISSFRRQFWVCPARPFQGNPDAGTERDCRFFFWKDELERQPPSPQAPDPPSHSPPHTPTTPSQPPFSPHTPTAPSQSRFPPLPTPTSPNTTQMNSPTKRTAPFKTTATPESQQKRMKAINDAMDIDNPASPPPSPTRVPTRPGINFANMPKLNVRPKAGPSSPTTPSKSSASEARLAAIRQALTLQSPTISSPPIATSHSNAAPVSPQSSRHPRGTVAQIGERYNLSELGIDLSGARPSVFPPRGIVPPKNSDSEDELWDSFNDNPPPESSQDEVANDLLPSPIDPSPTQTVVNGYGRDKGKQKALDERKEEEFWTSPIPQPPHQTGLFSPRTTTTPSTSSQTQPSQEELSGDTIQQFIENLAGIPEHVKKLERRLRALQKSNDSKSRRIQELEKEVQELKAQRRNVRF